MKVYRVEDDEGGGPYSGKHHRKVEIAYPKDAQVYWPVPCEDGLSDVPRDYVYGFASMKQVRAWFGSKGRRALAKLGFGLTVFDVDAKSVRRGYHQVAFHKDEAQPIKRLDLATL